MSDLMMMIQNGREQEVRQRALKLFTRANCPFSLRAKELLNKFGVDYEEHCIEPNDAQHQWIVQNSGRKVFPQMFVDGSHKGGFYELKRHCFEGTLHFISSPV